jgi:hypothetical protein
LLCPSRLLLLIAVRGRGNWEKVQMKKLAYTLATLTLFAGPAIALPSHSIPAPPVFSETQVIPAQTMGMERRAARREFRHERRAHRHEVRHERRMYRHGM